MLGKRYRNGYACVNFGEPVSLREWMTDRGLQANQMSDITPLANDLMQRIGNITPILPVALVTTLFARDTTARYSSLELKAAVLELLKDLENRGFRAYIPRSDYNYAVDVGVRMLTLRNILEDNEGVFSARPEEHTLLRYYSNSIAHLLDD